MFMGTFVAQEKCRACDHRRPRAIDRTRMIRHLAFSVTAKKNWPAWCNASQSVTAHDFGPRLRSFCEVEPLSCNCNPCAMAAKRGVVGMVCSSCPNRPIRKSIEYSCRLYAIPSVCSGKVTGAISGEVPNQLQILNKCRRHRRPHASTRRYHFVMKPFRFVREAAVPNSR